MPLASDPFASASALEGVPSALAAARDGIDALVRDLRGRGSRADVTAESLLRGAVASAQLEGSSSSLAMARAGNLDAIAAGAIRLSTELLSLVRVVEYAPLQALARMHALAAGPDEPARGRPRDDPPAVARMTALARRLVTPTRAPALAVAALVHAEIATARPFATANGLVARGAERLVLVARGVDPWSVIVPEAGHLAAADSYAESLVAYSGGGEAGVRKWLLHSAEAYSRGAVESPLNE
ncbi:MAG: oxidoreductase [Nocardioidaceae bacterium]